MDKQENNVTEKLIVDISAVMAGFYGKVYADNVKRQMLRRAKAGYAQQRPPFGYSKTETSGLFRINRLGRELRGGMQLAANGNLSADSLKFLVYLLISPTSNGLISRKTLRRIVTNPYYIGLVSYGGELYQGLHEPLVTVEEQQKVIELLEM